MSDVREQNLPRPKFEFTSRGRAKFFFFFFFFFFCFATVTFWWLCMGPCSDREQKRGCLVGSGMVPNRFGNESN